MTKCDKDLINLVNEIVIDFDAFKEKHKDNILLPIIEKAIEDTSSSWIREYSTVGLAGYNIITEKHGYDGVYNEEYCEAKPSNSYRDKTGKVKTKLNGGGNLNDYTFERFYKDKNENLYMIISGYIEGSIAYIFKFPFNSLNFSNYIEHKLNYLKHSAKPSTRWTIKFSYLHYKDDNVTIKYMNKDLINSNEEYFNSNFLKYIKELGDI